MVTRIPVLATSQAAFLARCLIRCRFEDRRHEAGAPAVMEVNPQGAEGEGGVRTARTESDGRHVIDEAAVPSLRAAVRIRMLVRRLSRPAAGRARMGEKMKKWQCGVCGFIYDEAQGLVEAGIAPGTRWADIPDTWVCPDCGASKSDFEMVEID